MKRNQENDFYFFLLASEETIESLFFFNGIIIRSISNFFLLKMTLPSVLFFSFRKGDLDLVDN